MTKILGPQTTKVHHQCWNLREISSRMTVVAGHVDTHEVDVDSHDGFDGFDGCDSCIAGCAVSDDVKIDADILDQESDQVNRLAYLLNMALDRESLPDFDAEADESSVQQTVPTEEPEGEK
eukprot:6460788-Amphidinium_carterae.2